MCGHYTRALKLFIQCGNREIDAAIEVVGKSQSDGLAHQLIGTNVSFGKYSKGDGRGRARMMSYMPRDMFYMICIYETAVSTMIFSFHILTHFQKKTVELFVDFLVGEKDGMPKDPNYIYR